MIIEPLQTVTEPFDGVDGSKFRKGQRIVCIQYLERTPSGNPYTFTLSQNEVYLCVNSVFYVGFDPRQKIRSNETDEYVSIILDDNELKNIHDHLSTFLYD